MDTLNVELCQSSAQGISSNHFFGWSWTKHLKYISMTLLMTSVWPSISRWYAEESFNVVPLSLFISLQNPPVNTLSLSDTVEASTPWSRIISSTKYLATVSEEKVAGRVPKWQNLVNMSTTTMITDLPLTVGKWMIKSMLMSCHTTSRIGRGIRGPWGLLVEGFILW